MAVGCKEIAVHKFNHSIVTGCDVCYTIRRIVCVCVCVCVFIQKYKTAKFLAAFLHTIFIFKELTHIIDFVPNEKHKNSQIFRFYKIQLKASSINYIKITGQG